MAASVVLQIQELCDHITDFLHDSSPALKSCALVSALLRSSAQHYISTTSYSIQAARPSMTPKHIGASDFPRLQVLVMHDTCGRNHQGTLEAGTGMIGLPTIHRLQFLLLDDTLVACYSDSHASVLTDVPGQLKIKELHRSQWIHQYHLLSPFDLNGICDGFNSRVSASKLIDPWRVNLKRLVIRAYPPTCGLLDLINITIVATHIQHLGIVPKLLAPLLLANHLQHLEVKIYDPCHIGMTSLQSLARELPLTAFPTPRRLTVLFLQDPWLYNAEETREHVRTAFEEWDSAGQLKVVVREDLE
ncbi:hypothetical protein C8R44DRAFT_883765 [Mycena epipterygia]|nr:hypothetical protein C8R44DRAFT_883765 [Mycena epipterygia]